MNPTIKEMGPLKLIGLRGTLRESQNKINDMSIVAKLWPQVMAEKISNRIGQERYAIITGDLPGRHEDEAYYYALVAVESFDHIPRSFTRYEIPKSKVVKFTHKGPPQNLSQTTIKVFVEWLPKSGESISEEMELFIYPAGYDRMDPKSQFDYYLFLE